MNTSDTIAAICTGSGGAISIIRISGSNALDVLNKIWKGKDSPSRQNARKLILGKISSGEPALAVFMPCPNSYTGDDIAEIQCHGGAYSTKKILEEVFKSGARPAEPGEFTFRAFMNGKMDLTQAEAVSDIITAHTSMALHLAEKQISGKLKSSINEIRNTLLDVLAECESRMDFPEEELDWKSPAALSDTIKNETSNIQKLLASKNEGAVLRGGIRAVIAGKPNAGKSSLMNLLLGYDRAIVTQIPGTTRDTLEEYANIRNIPVKLIDTAGIREADDIIESMGIERSKETIKQGQVILWLLDASSNSINHDVKELKTHTQGKTNVIAVWNKCDAAAHENLPDTGVPSVRISVKENSGIEIMLDLFEKAVWGYPHTEEPEIAVSARHAALLEEAIQNLPDSCEKIISLDWELAAVNLRLSMDALGKITGETADPDVLDNIFSRFCIGK